MLKKVIIFLIAFLIIAISSILMLQGDFKQNADKKNTTVESIYPKAVAFLNDSYNLNKEDSYNQLVSKTESDQATDPLKSCNPIEQWRRVLVRMTNYQRLVEIQKPQSNSDVHYILSSDLPHQRYEVDVSLLVIHFGVEKVRTGKLTYIKEDGDYKIDGIELDVLDGEGRYVFY